MKICYKRFRICNFRLSHIAYPSSRPAYLSGIRFFIIPPLLKPAESPSQNTVHKCCKNYNIIFYTNREKYVTMVLQIINYVVEVKDEARYLIEVTRTP